MGILMLIYVDMLYMLKPMLLTEIRSSNDSLATFARDEDIKMLAMSNAVKISISRSVCSVQNKNQLDDRNVFIEQGAK